MLATETITLPPISDPDAWEDIIPFDDVETPEIPATLLPKPYSDFAQALANETETAESLSVMMIFGVLSSALSKKFTVSPREGWSEPVNIYTMIALPPANNKSLVLKRCTEPLICWEKEQTASMEYDIKRCQSERKTEEKIIEAMRKKASVTTNHLTQRDLIQQISEKEAALIEVPVLPQIFANDTTPEALITSVHEQNGRFSIISDEGGIMEVLAGLYNNGHSNIDIFLKGIDGGEIRVRRKDRSFNLNPYLTITLAIQPQVLQAISEKRSFMGNGALERFLYVIPKSKLGYRLHDKQPMPLSLKDSYNSQIASLLAIKPENDTPYRLTLTNEALKAWRNFQNNIEIDLRPNGKLTACQGWGGKISGFVLRIAGLLHVSEFQTKTLSIDELTMNKAVCIGELLVEHAITAYGLMGSDQAIQDAKSVFSWITSNNNSSFKKTEIVSAMRNRNFGKAERLNKAIDVLIERNILSEPVKLPTKKPTILHYVNPTILSHGLHKAEVSVTNFTNFTNSCNS